MTNYKGNERLALDLGFSKAVLLENYQLEAEEKFRVYCNKDQCDRYGNSWVCPPGCGSVEDYQALFSKFNFALVLQTILSDLPEKWNLDDIYKLEREHNERLLKLLNLVRQSEDSQVLALTTGGCLLCEKCTFPQEPCSKPEIRMHSLSAAGIDVEKLCKKAGLDFSFNGSSVYYTACLVFSNI